MVYQSGSFIGFDRTRIFRRLLISTLINSRPRYTPWSSVILGGATWYQLHQTLFQGLFRKMILFGYFILGNVGETENEMLEIAPFARELGLDEIYLCPLRNEPFSSLMELVAQNPGYHVSPKGFIYSDFCSLDQLKQVRLRIRKDFFRIGTTLRLILKAYRNGLFKLRMLPRLCWFLIKQVLEHFKKVFRKSKKNISVNLSRSI